MGEKTIINGNTYIISYVYDENGAPAGLNINGSASYFVKNIQGDVLGLMSHTGTVFARYYYDAWGNLIYVKDGNGNNITNEESTALLNPFRYRGYFYDSETEFYYLGSRYYDSEVGRFINADNSNVLTVSEGPAFDKNLFAYCDNNPVVRKDDTGAIWETVFDIVSLASSVADVVANPANPWAWASLVGDVVDVAVPFLTGVGETTKIAKTVVTVVENSDDVIDTAKTIKRNIKKSSGTYVVLYESGSKYVGKGGFSRAIKSAEEHLDESIDKVTSIIWAPTSSSRKAFMSEALLQSFSGVGKNGKQTFNKIWSPGKKILENWGR